jgi:SAM-dependent methyltransferase
VTALSRFFTAFLHYWDRLHSTLRSIAERMNRGLKSGAYRFGEKATSNPGYGVVREKQIKAAIAARAFNQKKLPVPYGLGWDERVVEYPWLFSRLDDKPGKMLDAGSVLNFDYLLRRPELQSKQLVISTLAPESDNFWWRGVSYTYEDLRAASFRDEYFDSVVCLSVIEHVGMDNSVYTKNAQQREVESGDAVAFVKELHRVLKPGGTLFLSFPFGKASDLGWLRVFDLKMVEKLTAAFHPRMESQNFFRHGPKGWYACTPEAAADAGYNNAVGENPARLVAAEAVACLEWVK